MHICIDENSRYDESHVEWHYFKKTIIGKKLYMERNNWLIDEKILISFKLIYIWMKLHAPWIKFQLNSNLIELCSNSIATNRCKLM